MSEHAGNRLSKDENVDIFKKMANCVTLRLRNINAHRLFGQGVWLIQAKSAEQLRKFDVSRAVYVPMTSLSMFFFDSSLFRERINPEKEMLVAATYIVPEGDTLSYIWTKATFPSAPIKTPVKQTVLSPKEDVKVSRDTQKDTRKPKVNIPRTIVPTLRSPTTSSTKKVSNSKYKGKRSTK